MSQVLRVTCVTSVVSYLWHKCCELLVSQVLRVTCVTVYFLLVKNSVFFLDVTKQSCLIYKVASSIGQIFTSFYSIVNLLPET